MSINNVEMVFNTNNYNWLYKEALFNSELMLAIMSILVNHADDAGVINLGDRTQFVADKFPLDSGEESYKLFKKIFEGRESLDGTTLTLDPKIIRRFQPGTAEMSKVDEIARYIQSISFFRKDPRLMKDTSGFVQTWIDAFPDIDILKVIKSLVAWAYDNPKVVAARKDWARSIRSNLSSRNEPEYWGKRYPRTNGIKKPDTRNGIIEKSGYKFKKAE